MMSAMRNADIVLIEVDGRYPVFHQRDLRGHPVCRTPETEGLVGVAYLQALEHGGVLCPMCRGEANRARRHLTSVA
jgi:hypothetical protein